MGGWTERSVHYFVLSSAGKPVYHTECDETEVVAYMGVIQAIFSCFELGNALQSFRALGGTRFVFLDKSPLLLVAIDKLKRSEHQLRHQLELLHAQILSTLTRGQIERAFKARPNLDLRPLLSGTEVFLDALISDFNDFRPWSWLNALESLPVPRSDVREKIHSALLEARTPELLYGLLLCDGRFAGVVRPRRHSLHPPDLHLIFSMIFNTQAFNDGEVHWAPICLPRFNSNGFLYAYIAFVAPETALVLVTPNREAFTAMQNIHDRVLTKLRSLPIIMETLADAVTRGRLKPSSAEAPLITSFLYKSSAHVQLVRSDLDKDTATSMALLQAHMTKHRLRLCYRHVAETTLLGWHTAAFEMYCCAATKETDELARNVRRLVAWLRRHESRLFIVDGATF